MKGVNFSFNGVDAFDDMIKLIQGIYLESDDWDFEVVVTKEKNSYNVWIGDKDE